MNFDANTIATLMQLLNADKQGGNAENSACSAPKTVSTQSVDKSSVQSAFYAQNGIGEPVRIDFSQSKPKSPLDMLDAGQSPMLSMLKSLSGGKNDVSSMLPMLMSLMSKQSKSAKPCEDNSQSTQKSKNGSQNDAQNGNQDAPMPPSDCQNSANNNPNGSSTAPYGNKKTQRDVFEPVAFAGYEVVSTLAALLTAVRRPCR